jgi:hypothetical protein
MDLEQSTAIRRCSRCGRSTRGREGRRAQPCRVKGYSYYTLLEVCDYSARRIKLPMQGGIFSQAISL